MDGEVLGYYRDIGCRGFFMELIFSFLVSWLLHMNRCIAKTLVSCRAFLSR